MNDNACGLVCDIIGTWFLAYEIIWGYPNRHRGEIAELQLINMEKHVEEMIGGHRTLSTVYTESEIEKEQKTTHKWEPDIREKREAITLGPFLWAVLGALSLTVGFALQLKAALT
jgi:hypothetical protein